MFEKLKVITLILVKIIYNNNLFLNENNKVTLKLIAEKIKGAKNEASLNNIIKVLLVLEKNIELELKSNGTEGVDEKELIYNFIKSMSKLTKNDKFFKKIQSLDLSNKYRDFLIVFKENTKFLEKYLQDLNKQDVKYQEMSDVLNSMFETISKLPKTNDKFKAKLFEIKDQLDKTKDIKNIKKLKLSLMTMIDDIQTEITGFTKNINVILEENLKFANLKIQALESKVDEVLKDSYKDTLTGALNRKWFDDRFNDFFWFEHNNNHSFVILDIDHFKLVNDTYGHDVGDLVLKEVVKRFENTLRGSKEDRIIRYGGDEFILILIDVREDHLLSILNRLLESINSKTIEVKNTCINLTISIGASMFSENDSPGDLFKLTDKKLYLAKENGRNCFVKDI
jgi:diguanylate cyclase (GGDEF)-like protein